MLARVADGRLGGAALDVLAGEPAPLDSATQAASRQPRRDDGAEAARLRAALSGAMTQIDSLIAELERGPA